MGNENSAFSKGNLLPGMKLSLHIQENIKSQGSLFVDPTCATSLCLQAHTDAPDMPPWWPEAPPETQKSVKSYADAGVKLWSKADKALHFLFATPTKPEIWDFEKCF